MLHDDCKSVPGTFHFLSSKFSGGVSHIQFMFECCFMSHLSCLFESELTSWAHGHAVYLSLCLCVCGPTPASSVFIKSVSLLNCLHSYCPFYLPQHPYTPLSSNSMYTLTWFQRSFQRNTKENVFEQISTSFPFSPWLLCSVCLCQSDTVIITP